MLQSENSITDIKKRISLYLDNALDQKDCKTLIEQVSCNPKLQNIYTKEKDFRQYLKSNIARPSVSEGLITNIKNSIIPQQ